MNKKSVSCEFVFAVLFCILLSQCDQMWRFIAKLATFGG